jgi:hypothetical protein
MGPDYSGGMYEMHPQYQLLKKHVERCVQDIFMDGLKNRQEKLVLAFENEDQIDLFSNRLLKYWEDLENYEKCEEIVCLIEELKNTWKKYENIEGMDRNFMIADLFKNTENKDGLL